MHRRFILKISNRLFLPAALFIVLCFTGCGGSSESDGQQIKTVEKADKVFPVNVEVAKAKDIVDLFVLPAHLVAIEDVLISAEMSGPVDRVHFKEGDQIKKGDVILEIDSDALKSTLRRDKENVEVAERKLKRYLNLEDEGLVSRQDIEDLNNALVTARETLRSSQLMLDKSRPTSPLNGYVDEVYIDSGEFIAIGKPMIRLLQVDQLKVMVDVPEKDITYIKVGDKVDVILARMATQDSFVVEGTIEFIAYAADDTTKTYRTKIIIDNPGHLRPGMIVRAQFQRQARANVVTVPLYALIDDNGNKSVFLAEDGVARSVPVTIGRTIGQRVVILNGISAHDRVIVRGQQLLVDGSSIAEGSN
jgi:membrane fusion protein (multidrug efflux system)